MEGVGHTVIANVTCHPDYIGECIRRLYSRPPPHARACAPRRMLLSCIGTLHWDSAGMCCAANNQGRLAPFDVIISRRCRSLVSAETDVLVDAGVVVRVKPLAQWKGIRGVDINP